MDKIIILIVHLLVTQFCVKAQLIVADTFYFGAKSMLKQNDIPFTKLTPMERKEKLFSFPTSQKAWQQFRKNRIWTYSLLGAALVSSTIINRKIANDFSYPISKYQKYLFYFTLPLTFSASYFAVREVILKKKMYKAYNKAKRAAV